MNFTKSVYKEAEADTVVIGGGVAGCAAAIAAARQGVTSILIESGGVLGGQAAFGLVTPLDARKSKSGRPFGGILQEITELIESLGAKYCGNCQSKEVSNIAAPHILKYVLLKLCLKAGVKVFFHTVFIDAIKNKDKIKRIIVADKNGLKSVKGRVFIDASGDADLIAAACLPYTLGCESGVFGQLENAGLDKQHFSDDKAQNYDGKKVMQPVSIFFTMGGVDVAAAEKLNNLNLKFGDLGITREKFKSWEFAGSCGFEMNGDLIPLPQGRILVTRSPRPDVAVINMSRVTGINGSDAESLNEGEIKAQQQLIAIVDFLQTFVPGFENSYLIQSGASLGVRESRRLKGRYVLTANDAIYAKKFDYPIARGSYIIDIHDPVGKSRAIGGDIKGDFYDIPYGCLITDNAVNLLACGRCISADHVAHSSTRIQGTCIQTGQAAGTAAALSVKTKTPPAMLNAQCVHEQLIKDGMFLS